MRKLVLQLDWILLLSVILLITIGIFMVFSTSIGDNDGYSFVIRQAIYAFIGLFLALGVVFLGYRFLSGLSWVFFLGLIVLLIVTFVIGLETRGSTRWIDFGFFNLQASEIAKPILILTLSVFFVKNTPQKLKSILLSALIAAFPTLLVFFQPDLGSSIVLGLIWLGMTFIAGIKVRYFLGFLTLGLIALPIGFNFLKAYQRERLLSFLNPTADPLGSGYNLVQAIIAVGSGQFLGRGFGRGTQSHLNFLPEQKTDFIFATTAEELGFIGVIIMLILFSVIIWRIMVIGSRAEKTGALICYGTALVLVSQVFVNAGMNMGLLPITGITLPFVSFGGSSLISMLILIGLVQSIHITTKNK